MTSAKQSEDINHVSHCFSCKKNLRCYAHSLLVFNSRVRTILTMTDFPIPINRVAEIGGFDFDFCASCPVDAKYNIAP